MKRRSFLTLLAATLIPPNLLAMDSVRATNKVAVTAHVEDEYAPYVVHGTITDNKTGLVTTLHERVTKGEFNKVLTYEADHDVVFNFEVTASRSGSSDGYLRLGRHLAKLRNAQRVVLSTSSPS